MEKLKPILLIAIPEILFSLLIFAGIWMKKLHLPIANMFLTLILLTLSFFYMVLGTLIFSNVDPRKLKIGSKTELYSVAKMIFGFMAGLCMAIFVVGCWEKILRLPEANVMLYCAVILGIFLLIGSISMSFKFPRFFLTYVRLLSSVLLILMPFAVLWRGFLKGLGSLLY